MFKTLEDQVTFTLILVCHGGSENGCTILLEIEGKFTRENDVQHSTPSNLAGFSKIDVFDDDIYILCERSTSYSETKHRLFRESLASS